jgi:glyoxylase-like metal-dependent hydrolase (beta-lactamase superfamily II)
VTGLAVADSWFERRSLADGIVHLWEPHVDPVARCNIWYVRGRGEDLLIDSGMGLASLRAELEDLTDKPLRAFATHSHFDHVGSFHEFPNRFMHTAEAAGMASGEVLSLPLRVAELPKEVIASLEEAGYAFGGEFLISALPRADYDPASYRVAPAPPTRTVEEGDVVDLGDRHFEVLHLPGHSPGSIGLYEQATATLFSGDAIYDGPLLDNLPDSDVGAYRKTMQRLREIPVDVVHAGHEPSFGRERLRELADAYLARTDGSTVRRRNQR